MISNPEHIVPGIKLYRHMMVDGEYREECFQVFSVKKTTPLHAYKANIESALLVQEPVTYPINGVTFTRAQLKKLYTWSFDQYSGRGIVYMTKTGPKVARRSALPRVLDLARHEQLRRIKRLAVSIPGDIDVVYKRVTDQRAYISELSVLDFGRLLTEMYQVQTLDPIDVSVTEAERMENVARFFVAGGSLMSTIDVST